MNEEFEMTCFQIITYVGTARTCFINAIQSAKEGNFEEAEELIKLLICTKRFHNEICGRRLRFIH